MCKAEKSACSAGTARLKADFRPNEAEHAMKTNLTPKQRGFPGRGNKDGSGGNPWMPLRNFRQLSAMVLLSGTVAWMSCAGLAQANLACRLSSPISASEDIAIHVSKEFGAGAAVADWMDIREDYAREVAKFYEETGLADGARAFVIAKGERFYDGDLQYFVVRSESGPPAGEILDHFDTLYLRCERKLDLPVVASITYRLSVPIIDSDEDIPKWLAKTYGVGAVMVDWNEIKANFAPNPRPFYRQTGLPDGEIAFVTAGGERYHSGDRHYYVFRSDSAPPAGDTYDSFDSLYLQSWHLEKQVVYKLVAPEAPTGVAASDDTSSAHISVSWNTSGVLSYEVWRSTTNDSATASFRANVTESPFLDTGAIGGVTYFYWVKAVGVGGTSGFSAGDSGRRLFTIALGTTSTRKAGEATNFGIQVISNGGWSASDDQTWISVAPVSGTGNRTVTVALEANLDSMLTRQGTVNIGGLLHTVTQEGRVVAAGNAFRLTSSSIAETESMTTLISKEFGPAASLADWKQIVGHAAGDPPLFYEQISLADIGLAWVSQDGSRWLPAFPDRHYFIERFDAGAPPTFGIWDQVGSLHLGAWKGLTNPAVAKMRYRLSMPVADPFNTDTTAASVFGLGSVIAEWNEIKADYAASPSAFFAHSGLRDEGLAWVKYNGSTSTGSLFYFIQRFDLGAPSSFTVLDQIGSLYLGRWYDMNIPVMVDVGNTDPAEGFYPDWIRNFTTLAVVDRDPGDDSDGDGDDNLTEYASGGHPQRPDSLGRLFDPVSGPAGAFAASFHLNPNANGLTFPIQWSLDLSVWAGAGDSIGGVIYNMAWDSVSTTPDHLILRVTATPGASQAGKVFLHRVITTAR
jgi:hypothetical protein